MNSARQESSAGQLENWNVASPMAYAPLYVTPLYSTEHPTPHATSTALYALSAPPQFVLEIGTRVHLHFLYAPPPNGIDSSPSEPNPMSVPLAIRGWIAGERMRSSTEVEYVVKNEEGNSPIRRAFVRLRNRAGMAPLPNLSEQVARRFPGVPTDAPKDAEKKKTCSRRPRVGPARMHGPAGQSALGARENERSRTPTAPRPEYDDLPRLTVPLYPMDDSARERAPNGGHVTAAQPYSIWETYGGNTALYATQAETDAIRNYGCPIIVGPLVRLVEQPIPNLTGPANTGDHAGEREE